ncbi:MAG TPA: hypothetical protein VLN59_14305 [Burkholderiales bacterium]|nr:hypothetical protein [Burkholderiales bacterium]
MTENPYRDPTPIEHVETERTVIVDQITGAITTIGARVERISIDAEGRQRREVTHAVAASADHAQLLFPYDQPLWRCAVCGAQPLAKPFFCAACARPVCAACRVIANDVVLCRDCGSVPWWVRFFRWLLDMN